jgi:hypothetical protein
MRSGEGGEPTTGDKIKAKGSFENEQEELGDGVCDPDDAKAISIWGSPNDAHGHSEQISFRANSLYLRLAMEVMAREPSFHFVSDLHRTVYRPGCGVILKNHVSTNLSAPRYGISGDDTFSLDKNL